MQRSAPAAEAAPKPGTASTLGGALGGSLLGLLLPVAVAVLYEAAAYLGLVSTRLVPAPSSVLATLWDLALKGELWTHARATLMRVGAGFLFGAIAATVIGAATGYSALARRLLDPTLQALRNVPSIAWVPLFILWFGIFEQSKITLIAVGVFFPVYLGVMGAIMSVDRKIVEVGRAFRLSGPQLVRRILLPAVLPGHGDATAVMASVTGL